jgi:hypothetical protein
MLLREQAEDRNGAGHAAVDLQRHARHHADAAAPLIVRDEGLPGGRNFSDDPFAEQDFVQNRGRLVEPIDHPQPVLAVALEDGEVLGANEVDDDLFD